MRDPGVPSGPPSSTSPGPPFTLVQSYLELRRPGWGGNIGNPDNADDGVSPSLCGFLDSPGSLLVLHPLGLGRFTQRGGEVTCGTRARKRAGETAAAETGTPDPAFLLILAPKTPGGLIHTLIL